MITKKDEYLLKRRKKRINQSEIAKQLGVSQSHISRYEKGVSGMSEQNIKLYREYIDKK